MLKRTLNFAAIYIVTQNEKYYNSYDEIRAENFSLRGKAYRKEVITK